jgi:transposase
MSKKRPSGTGKKNTRVLEQINHNAAGADLGSREVWIGVGDHVSDEPVQKFGTTTSELRRSAEWMRSCGVETVAMEATGVYWVAAFEIYEEYGLNPVLVSSRAIRSFNGMKKSDYIDCQWLHMLHTFGILQASLRAEAEMIELRAYMRQRRMLTEKASEHIQHMQKALVLMNVRLDQAVTDITGVTGMNILRAILAGKRDPKELAMLRDPACAKSEEQIAEALTGHYREEQLFALKQSVELWDFHRSLIGECDKKIQAVIETLPIKADRTKVPSARGKRGKPRKNEVQFDLRTLLFERLGLDLTQIAGLHILTILTVISECGIDLSRFPTGKHFCSWLGLSPGTKITGGRVISSRSRRTANRASTALRVAAQALASSKTELGAFYRRKKGQIGPEKAINATAAKLARRIYDSLRTGHPYSDRGADFYDLIDRKRALASLQKRARNLNMKLVPIDQTEAA